MKRRYQIRTHALFAGLLILFAALTARNLIHNAQDDRIGSVVDTFSQVFTTKLEEQIHNRMATVELIRRNWEEGRMGSVDAFADVAAAVHAEFTDLQALNWVNPKGVVEIATPLAGNEAVVGVNLRTLEVPARTLRAAERENRLRVTSPILLQQGGRGFTGYVPIRTDGALTGFLNLVFRSQPLIAGAMGEGTSQRFQVRIADGTDVVYGPDASDQVSEFAETTRIDVAGRTWTITTTPTPSEIARAQTLLDEYVLVFGVCLAIAVYLLLNETAQNKETLRRSEERFALAMKGASDGLFDWDVASGKVYYSPRWFEMLGYQPGELPADITTFQGLLHPDDADRAVKDAETVSGTEGDITENEFRMRHRNGTWVNVLSRAYILRKNGSAARVVGTHVDITELRSQQREMERAAMTDDLTGLSNRRGMSRSLAALAEVLRDDRRIGILHIDLDLFKSINDMNGHDAGDAVLKTIAGRLSDHPARFDTVARIGGDEFLIALQTAADDDRVTALATQLIEEISQPIDFEGKMCRVGASVGIAFVAPGDTTSIDCTIANADIALNSSKSLGRGRSVVFEPQMREEAVHAVAVASEIREGLGRDEFTPFFQPQIDMKTKQIIGFEALARWTHPKNGIVTAANFVPFAERAHLVDAIDDQIFKKACRAVSALADAGAPGARVSVNLSTAQLSDPALVDRLIWTADAENVEPAMICIEILEATLISERTVHIIRNIDALARAGFAIELDDFGTGHTAIASLRNFPVSRIKIDKSLITDIDGDGGLQAIAGAIIDLGTNLGINVLAEGIETQAEFDYLASTRCGHAQGYLICRPMPFEDLAEWIAVWNGEHRLGADETSLA